MARRNASSLQAVEGIDPPAAVSQGHDEPAPAVISVVVVEQRLIVAEALSLLLRSMPGLSAQPVSISQLTRSSLQELQPDVVLLATEAGAPLQLPPALIAAEHEFQTVLLADAVTPELVEIVFEQRLGGLLLTDLSATDMAICLDQIARGRTVLPRDWQGVMASRADDPLQLLSRRQLEVLELLAAGRSYDAIARSLFISVNTVKFHVRSIFARLGIHSRFEAAHLLERRSTSGEE